MRLTLDFIGESAFNVEFNSLEEEKDNEIIHLIGYSLEYVQYTTMNIVITFRVGLCYELSEFRFYIYQSSRRQLNAANTSKDYTWSFKRLSMIIDSVQR